MKKNISQHHLIKIQELVGDISEDDLQYVDIFIADHLGLFIPSVGFCQYAIRAGHTHPTYSFVIFFSADQNFLEVAIDLPEGHYLGACLSPDLPHEEKETDTFTRYLALFIDRHYFERLKAGYVPEAQNPPIFWEQFPVSPDTMTDIKRFMSESEQSHGCTKPYLNTLSELITHDLLRDLYPQEVCSQAIAPKLDVSAVLDYMEEHFGERLTVSTLARKMGLSDSQFSRRFKQETGSSPMDFFMALRIRKAQKLLRSGSRTMTEIGQDCGFGSAAHFSAAFKTQTGLSPTVYQQLYQKP